MIWRTCMQIIICLIILRRYVLTIYGEINWNKIIRPLAWLQIWKVLRHNSLQLLWFADVRILGKIRKLWVWIIQSDICFFHQQFQTGTVSRLSLCKLVDHVLYCKSMVVIGTNRHSFISDKQASQPGDIGTIPIFGLQVN